MQPLFMLDIINNFSQGKSMSTRQLQMHPLRGLQALCKGISSLCRQKLYSNIHAMSMENEALFRYKMPHIEALFFCCPQNRSFLPKALLHRRACMCPYTLLSFLLLYCLPILLQSE